MTKIVLYCIMVPISMWVLECIKMDNVFKKGRLFQIKAFYVMLSLALAYLVTNFLYDFAFYSSSMF